MERKKLPVAAEAAIAQAIRAVRDIGGDQLVIDAIVQRMRGELDRAGFDLRPGFEVVAKGVVDLSGRDKFKALAERSAARAQGVA